MIVLAVLVLAILAGGFFLTRGMNQQKVSAVAPVLTAVQTAPIVPSVAPQAATTPSTVVTTPKTGGYWSSNSKSTTTTRHIEGAEY